MSILSHRLLLHRAWYWLPLWLLPALLPWGRSAELATLCCWLGAFRLWRQGNAKMTAGLGLWLVLFSAYLVAACGSVPFALHPAAVAASSLGLIRILGLGLFACWALRAGRDLQGLYTALGILVAGWCLDAWLQIISGWSLGGPAQAERITGIFGAANLKLGPVLAVMSPFLLDLAQRYRGRRGGLIGWCWVAGPVVLSGARSAWISLLWVGLLYSCQLLGSWPRVLRVVVLAMLAAGLLGSVAWHDSPRFHARLERSFNMFDGSRQGLDKALSGRLEIWTTASRMIEAKPWFGVGIRQFRNAYPAYASPDDHFLTIERCGPGQGACHPHQWLLEVLTETGLVGALCWLLGIAAALRVWWLAPRWRRQQAFPATVAVAAIWFPFNTHLAFYAAWWGLFSMCLLALWCASISLPTEVAEHV